MSTHRILSVDTAYDKLLKLFANSRKKYYKEFDEDIDYHVTQLYGSGAYRSNFLEQCELRSDDGEPFFNYLTICSHGNSDGILNKEFGNTTNLVSVDDPDDVFTKIANGRAIYILACEVGEGRLLDMFVNNGARSAVGFSEKPFMGCSESNQFWRNIDVRLISCFVDEDYHAAIERVLDELYEEIEVKLPDASPQFSKDLGKIRLTLESIKIL